MERALLTTQFVTFLNLIFVLYWASEEYWATRGFGPRAWSLLVMAFVTFAVPIATQVLVTKGG